MKNFYLYVILILSSVFLISSCSDNDENGKNPHPANTFKGAYLINQGNMAAHISSSIGYLNMDSLTLSDSAFFRANNVIPGNTLQSGIIYGSHFYAIAYESNMLFVTDKNTLKLQKTISLNEPRALAVANGKLYISNYDGFISRLDTLSLTIDAQIKVGPNPEELAVAGNYLYVCNSDGMNFLANYENGKSVSKINLQSFTEEKKISVGLNPCKMGVDQTGNVFVIAMGDYYMTPSLIQKIDADDQVTDVAEASMMAIDETTLYAIKSETDWMTYTNSNTFFAMDTRTLKTIGKEKPEADTWPNFINVDPKSKHIFVGYCNTGAYGADYTGKGYLNEFDSQFALLHTYATGVYPVQLVFE